MRARPGLGVVFAAMVAVTVAAAGAQPATAHAADTEVTALLAQAGEHKAALRYEEGLRSLAAALALGLSGPAELRAIHRSAGEMAAGLGRSDEAEAHFRRWLLLEPDGTLPPGTSPKLMAPLAAARTWLIEHGALTLRVEVVRRPTRRVALVVVSDPLGWVTGLRVRAGDEVREARAPGSLSVELPTGPVEITAAALDAHGNELWVRGAFSVDDQPRKPRPWLSRPWLWGTAGLALAGAGLAFGAGVVAAQEDFDAIVAGSGMHTLGDAEAAERRGRRYVWLANGSFVAAGACGVAAVVLAWRARGSAETGATVTPLVGAHGIGVSVQGRF